MSFEKRRTATVLGVIQKLVEDGKTSFRPGDVNSALRARDNPMGTWEVRAEFTKLEADALIECDSETGDWHLTESASLRNTGS